MIKKRIKIYKAPPAYEFSGKAMFENAIPSANECTGITPTVPETENEAESYCDIASIPVTSRDGGQAHKRDR